MLTPPPPFPLLPGLFVCYCGDKMVKLGNNFSEKNSGKVVSEDGFDTIPLITPLDASQLHFPPPEKVRSLCFFAAVTPVAFLGSPRENEPCLCSILDSGSLANCHACASQVVVKTKADYDSESKRGKLRSPKIAEFSISIIEGVSERLKVRTNMASVTSDCHGSLHLHPCSSAVRAGFSSTPTSGL